MHHLRKCMKLSRLEPDQTMTRYVSFALCLLLGCAHPSMVNERQPARILYSSPSLLKDTAAVSGERLFAEQPPPWDTLPVVMKKVVPAYPDLAVRAGIEGDVTFMALILPDGTKKHIVPRRTDAEIFLEPVAEAIKGWVFKPPVMDGHPRPVWVQLTFRFILSNGNPKVIVPE